MRTTRGRRSTRVLAALAVLALVVAGCGDDDDEATDTTTTAVEETTPSAADTDTTTDTTEPSEPDDQDGGGLVYFALGETIGAAGRPDAAGDPEAATEALLAGPDATEVDFGMGTEIPEGTELLGVTVEDGVAIVDLSGSFESGGGSLSMGIRVAQVVFTVTQFEDVDTVDIHLDGAAVDAIGGEGVQAAELDRSDFPNETPAVLVESPFPGEEVTSPVEVTGASERPGDAVVYNVTDGEGLIVAEGEAPVAEDGTFTANVEFEAVRGGFGAVIVWHDDGSGGQEDVYEVPVRVEAGA